MTYAQNTTVPADRSKAEIERLLTRYGATAFAYGWQPDGEGKTTAVVMFTAKNRRIQFVLPMPSQDEERFKKTPGGRRQRSPDAIYQAWEQETRSRWRALRLVIQAKLEAVETGIVDFEREFLAHIVLPDGGTAGDFLVPQIAKAYSTGKMPPLLVAHQEVSDG